LHAHVSERLANAPGSRLYLGTRAQELGPEHVTLADGTRLAARFTVDARGPELPPAGGPGFGFQKFLGLELSVQQRANLREPILMDALLPQEEGFRFMYVLPFAADRVLIEETFFAEQPELDRPRSRAAILRYAHERGFEVRAVLREEEGVLPMPWNLPPVALGAGPIRAGYRAGFFHPVTGYSFPLALRFARALSVDSEQPRAEHGALAALVRQHNAQLHLLRTLVRMMFEWFPPAQRYHVLEHFYRLPEPVIERFYAAELGALDAARLFWGAPPRGLSIRRALSSSLAPSRPHAASAAEQSS
jgi:lycopene beta-cyclase